MTDFLKGYPHPRVFFVRVANKGLMLDAASRMAGKGLKVARFRVASRQPVKVMNKELSSGEDWQEPIEQEWERDAKAKRTERRLSRESIDNGSMDYPTCQ
jgi:hypothetical protein